MPIENTLLSKSDDESLVAPVGSKHPTVTKLKTGPLLPPRVFINSLMSQELVKPKVAHYRALSKPQWFQAMKDQF